MSAIYTLDQAEHSWPIATAQIPHSESASVGISIPVGSRHETVEEQGIAHFIEHMLFKGTETRNAKEIVSEIEGYGGTINAWTTEDQTFFEARGPEDLLETMMEVLCDMLFHSVFDPAEIERERNVICEEIVMYQENPSDHISDLMSQSLWQEHPLGRPITGTIESVQALTREQMLHFMEKHYFSNKTFFAVAAPQSHQQVNELWQTNLTKTPNSTQSPFFTSFSDKAWQRSQIIQKSEIEQIHLGLSFLCEGRASKQRHSLGVLSTLFGETMSSRLFQKLREEAGVCYHIETDLTLFAETGSFSICAGLDASQLDASLNLLSLEIEDLVCNGPSEEEIGQAKRYLIGQHRISLETSDDQLHWITSSIHNHKYIVDPKRARESIRNVNRSSILEGIEKVFSREEASIAAIGPIDNDRSLL